MRPCSPRHTLAVLFLIAASAGATTPGAGFNGMAQRFIGLAPNGRAYLSVSLGATGEFTGALDYAAGTRDSIKGTIDSAGFFSGTAGASKTPYTLQVTGTGGTSASSYLSYWQRQWGCDHRLSRRILETPDCRS